MRSWAMMAAFALLVTTMPALAQRGGGHASGGHGGLSGHMSGGSHFGGMRSGSAMGSRGLARGPASSQRSFPRQSLPRQSFARQSFARQSFGRQSLRQRAPVFRGNRFSNPRFRAFGLRNCFGCLPWGYGGFYDPYWWWDSGSSYDEDYERDRAYADQMNQQSLEQQQMRQQGDQDIYAQPAPRQTERAESKPAEVVPPTVLVFRDQRKEEVQNYAIVGQTLWNFAPQHTQRIPLSDLDLTATAEVNDERGVEFRIPRPGQGQ